MAQVRDGWAYRLEHPQATTVGVVRRRGAGAAALDGTLAGDLDIDDPENFVRAGMCPAAAVAGGRTPPEICAALARVGVADTSARALVAWAIRVGTVG